MLTYKHAQPNLMYMPYKINIKSVNYNLISPFSAALYVVRSHSLTFCLCSSLLLLLSLPLYFPMFRFVIQLLVALGSLLFAISFPVISLGFSFFHRHRRHHHRFRRRRRCRRRVFTAVLSFVHSVAFFIIPF